MNGRTCQNPRCEAAAAGHTLCADCWRRVPIGLRMELARMRKAYVLCADAPGATAESIGRAAANYSNTRKEAIKWLSA